MKIERVRLRNIRPFTDSGEIEFGEGTISVYGENGAGKSTLVDCIGRAVFGADPHGIKQAAIRHRGATHKQGASEYLLRKGATDGSIEVTFSNNGTSFRVVNALSRAAPQTWELYVDGENTKLLGKEEIHERIFSELGIANGYRDSAASLFADIVCVRQGQIIHEFEFRTQERKNHFDRVLGLYRYRQADEDAKHVKNTFKDRANKKDSDVRVIESQVEKLSELVETLEDDEEHATRLERELEQLHGELTELDEQKRALDTLATRIKELEADLAQIDAAIGKNSINVTNTETELKNCRDAKKANEESYPAFKRHNELSEELESVREHLRQIAALKEVLSATQRRHDSLGNDRANKEKRLEEYYESRKRATELKSYYDRYRALQSDLDSLEKKQQSYERVARQRQEKQEGIRERVTRIGEIDAELTDYEALKREAALFDGLNAELNAVAGSIGELTGQKNRLERDLENLLNGVCPYTSETCASIQTLGHRHEKEAAEIEHNLVRLEAERRKKAGAIQRAAQSRDTLQALDVKKGQRDHLHDEVEKLRAEVRELDAEADTLGDASASIAQLTDDLHTLEPKADEYKAIEFSVHDFDERAVLGEINDIGTEQSRLTSDIEGINDGISRLSEAGGSRENEVALSTELQTLQSAYDRYVSSLADAQQLETVAATLRSFEDNHVVLNDQRERVNSSVEQERRGYDEAAHRRVEAECDHAMKRYNERNGTLAQLRVHIDKGRSYKRELEQKKEELMVEEVELGEITADIAFFDEIRTSFKHLSGLRSAFTKEINRRAARYWNNLVNDASELHLQEDDYLIYKTRNDDVISLFEMSGGEKISACLATRLALQEFVGGLGLFILDEPTVHLDEERRTNLATQIGGIEGLDQVIVISHDDSFHSYTKQQITISKRPNGDGSAVTW